MKSKKGIIDPAVTFFGIEPRKNKNRRINDIEMEDFTEYKLPYPGAAFFGSPEFFPKDQDEALVKLSELEYNMRERLYSKSGLMSKISEEDSFRIWCAANVGHKFSNGRAIADTPVESRIAEYLRLKSIETQVTQLLESQKQNPTKHLPQKADERCNIL